MTNISLYKIFTFNVILIFFLIIFSKDSMAGAGSKEIDEIQINKNPLEINDGCLNVPIGPGFGVNINEKALEKFKL